MDMVQQQFEQFCRFTVESAETAMRVHMQMAKYHSDNNAEYEKHVAKMRKEHEKRVAEIQHGSIKRIVEAHFVSTKNKLEVFGPLLFFFYVTTII